MMRTPLTLSGLVCAFFETLDLSTLPICKLIWLWRSFIGIVCKLVGVPLDRNLRKLRMLFCNVNGSETQRLG